ncbi:sulfatase-like hydrolase/transferase [Tunicatimonas pelagia]|uniref:sulfatase-like hydrolase/transferase n=1 Tax=Tunicatimonas pelagia TaxID=931531 RepID=UPI0026660386|nr:sulfatase-like hydrolase/transferase [Tunicatimonas pelagia]WKN42439.1 sulfatase-like hydrolase/transferase [Tunicatimonas pelagia]
MANTTTYLAHLIALWLIWPILLTTHSLWAQNSDQAQPNVIVILVDDLGYGDVNFGLAEGKAFRNPYVQTPNLAKLAGESLVLQHHYAASPVCSPSRAGLLTGRTPTRYNINLYIRDNRDDDLIFLPGREVTIAEVLQSAGYQTAIFGKWHLNGADWEDPKSWTGWTGSFPKQQGFEAGMVSKENPHFTRLLKTNTQQHPGDFFSVDGKPLGPIKGYTSDIITEAATNWLKEERDVSRPFFLYLPYDAVHIRVAAADEYVSRYNTGDARKDAYYANITHLDATIGNLLSSLDSLNLTDNTLLFFSSDNGPDVLKKWEATYYCYGTSYPLAGQKYQLYEGGIRVLGLVRWPGKIAPGISDAPNSTLDILPTFCELVRQPLPNDRPLDGVSILSHLTEGKPIEREKPLYWQFEDPREFVTIGEGYDRRLDGSQKVDKPSPVVAIREGNYVLRGFQNKAFTLPTEFTLYDVVNDPEELEELSKVKSDLFASMKQQLLEMYRAVNAEREKTAVEIEQKVSQLE